MKRPSAVIAEDEANLRDELLDALAAAWPDLDVVACAHDGDDALAALDRYAPDILFLDIRMPGMNGLEVAHRASQRAHVVFVTAYEAYAVAAFEAGAVDYLLKPLVPARLAETVRRLKVRVTQAPADLDALLARLAAIAGRPEYMRYITAVYGDDIRLITVDEICYFQSDNKYTRVVTPERESLIRRPLHELLASVDPAVFWQIHRGTVVNINAVSGLTRDFRGQLRVRLKARKETLAVSERYAFRFRQM